MPILSFPAATRRRLVRPCARRAFLLPTVLAIALVVATKTAYADPDLERPTAGEPPTAGVEEPPRPSPPSPPSRASAIDESVALEAPSAQEVPPSDPTPTPAPRAFPLATEGTVLLSVDQAFPLLSFGGTPTLDNQVSLSVFDPTIQTRRPLSVDMVVGSHFTVGGAFFTEQTLVGKKRDEVHQVGALGRIGWLSPLSSKVAVWPRLGASYLLDEEDEGTDVWQLEADVRLLYAIGPSVAFTFGPSISVPLSSEWKGAGDAPPPVRSAETTAAVGDDSVHRWTRVAFSLGFVGKLGGAEADTDAGNSAADDPLREPTILIGLDRLVPLVRYRVDRGEPFQDLQGTLGVATADMRSEPPQAPRVSFDVRTRSGVTLGAAGSVGYARASNPSGSIFPERDADSYVAWSIAPRVGWYATFVRGVAFWPKAGITYTSERTADGARDLSTSTKTLGLDVDVHAVLSPTPGFGFVVGPSGYLPILATAAMKQTFSDSVGATHKVLAFGLYAGLVVTL